MTWKVYRDATHHCSEKIHVAKVQLELKLAKTVGDKKGSFKKYINSKRQCRNYMGLLQSEDSHLMNRDTEKLELLTVFFASIFNTDDGLWETQCPEMEDFGRDNP